MGGHGLERAEPHVRLDRPHRPVAHPVGPPDALRRRSGGDGGNAPRCLDRERVRRRGTPAGDRRVGAAAARRSRRRGVRRRRLARSCVRRATLLAPTGRSRSVRIDRDPDLDVRPRTAERVRDAASRSTSRTASARRGLLAIATHGVVFAPGSAGTIQEIFQDAAQNHYASFGPPSPMMLLGVDYWTRASSGVGRARVAGRESRRTGT